MQMLAQAPCGRSGVYAGHGGARSSHQPPIARFPAIEPPAPLYWRTRPARIRRKWTRDRLAETPSWLLSLVTHAILLILIATLGGSSRRQTVWSPMTITLAPALEQDETTSAEPQFFLATPTAANGGQHGQYAHLAQAGQQPAVEAIAHAAVDDSPAWLPEVRLTSVAHVKRPKGTVAEPHDAGTVRRDERPRKQVRARSSATPDQSQFVSLPQPDDGMDGIVNRFIAYDTGRLRGVAGTRAREDFNRLGPEAIPALVRGLNKAAGIRASCPVGVITNRLDDLLPRAEDPQLIQYALEHLGRDIDPRDPHYRRIQSAAQQWRRLLQRRVRELNEPAASPEYLAIPAAVGR